MDLLQEIEKKSKIISERFPNDGIQAAIRHIKASERYFARARYERDDDLFNDVIYRANQAFEGMLKEAYSIITDKDGTELSPYKIEKYLIDNKVLTNRVLDLFTNYRQQWRNPSTHDHKLFFGEQEALLAIVSVSAFVNILLDQIIETISYKIEKEELKSNKQNLDTELETYRELPFHKQVIKLLVLFNVELIGSKENLKEMREVELIGQLNGFINSIDSSIVVSNQPILAGTRQLRPDFILSKNGESIVIELKRPGYSKRNLEYSFEQVSTYLSAGNFDYGIIYLPSTEIAESIEVTKQQLAVGNRSVSVYVIASKPR